MSYTNNIPNATDLISNSQSQIKANFTAIDSGSTGTGIGFSRNHVTMTDATNGGLHNRVDFYQAVTAPSISGFTSSAYAKTANSISELYYKNGTAETQVTKSSLTTSSGEGFIPGGLQVRTGAPQLNAQGDTFTFSTAFPTACLAVICTNRNAGNNLSYFGVTASSTTGFTLRKSDTDGTLPQPFFYVAIGY